MKLKIVLLFFISVFRVYSIDNPHFYRGSYFFGEPRIAKDNLFTPQIRFSGGGTAEGQGARGKTNVLQIYGQENIFELANGAPDCVLNKNPNGFINDLWQQTPAGKNFGKLDFYGHFQTMEVDFDVQQNFKKGIFAELYVPIRELQINNISYKDLSTRANAGSDIDFAQWQNFIIHLEDNLKQYGVCIHSSKSTKLADMTALLGWTINYEETEYIDFIDFSLKSGVIFPFGKKNIDNVFALSQGYGHWGFPVYADVSVGLYEWLTLGGHLAGIVFADNNQKIFMKTSNTQNGSIKLSKGIADVDLGSIFNIGLFLKGDHVNRRLSFLLAYRYDQQFSTKLYPFEVRTFNASVVNDEEALRGWSMHTIDFSLEYDFATYEHPDRPRLELFLIYPLQVSEYLILQ